MSEVKKLVLKNYLLEPLVRFLNRQELKTKISRARMRIIDILIERGNSNEKLRLELLDKYAKKGEDGKPLNENGKPVFENGNEDKANEEWRVFLIEDTIFDVLPSNEADFDMVRGILENTEEKLSDKTVPTYRDFEKVLEAFKSIK